MNDNQQPPVRSAADFLGLFAYLFVVGGDWSPVSTLPAPREAAPATPDQDRPARPSARRRLRGEPAVPR